MYIHRAVLNSVNGVSSTRATSVASVVLPGGEVRQLRFLDDDTLLVLWSNSRRSLALSFASDTEYSQMDHLSSSTSHSSLIPPGLRRLRGLFPLLITPPVTLALHRPRQVDQPLRWICLCYQKQVQSGMCSQRRVPRLDRFESMCMAGKTGGRSVCCMGMRCVMRF